MKAPAKPGSVEAQIRFRELIAAPTRHYDEIDEAAADPIHDHTPQARPKHKASSVLRILDQLDKETPNRRCEL